MSMHFIFYYYIFLLSLLHNAIQSAYKHIYIKNAMPYIIHSSQIHTLLYINKLHLCVKAIWTRRDRNNNNNNGDNDNNSLQKTLFYDHFTASMLMFQTNKYHIIMYIAPLAAPQPHTCVCVCVCVGGPLKFIDQQELFICILLLFLLLFFFLHFHFVLNAVPSYVRTHRTLSSHVA